MNHRTRNFCIFSLALLLLTIAGCNGFFTPRNDTTTPATKFAFVANFQNATAGSISVFSVNTTTGALTSVGSSVSTGSNGPAALVTVAGKFLYSANDAGTVSAFTVNTTTGALTAVSGSPFNTNGNNPNAITADPSGKFLYVANSGSDDISAFTIDATTGSLTAIGLPVLTGTSSTTSGPPVSVAVHPNGKFLYAAMDSSGIAVLSINTTTGALTFVNTIAAQSNTHPQAVVVEKTGKFAYVADGVSAVDEFSIDSTTGNLTLLASPNSTVAAGTVPIVMTSDSTGSHLYVASQSSNNAFSFGILTTGALTAIGTPLATGASPSSIAIESSGKFVYVTNFSGSPDISIFSIDSAGKLVSAGSASSGVSPANAASIAFL
jgi:6-phosphogluconolactonase